MNQAIISGNLGSDPEVRTTNSGMVIANLRIASNERVKKGDQWEDHTEWHRVVVFGKTAENVQKYLKKGDKALVVGKIRTKEYEKDGVKKYSTEIVCDTIEFLSTTQSNGNGGNSGGGAASGGGGKPSHDDDIPF